MRPFLMLFCFFLWALLFSACEEEENEQPTLLGTWILEESSGLSCDNKDRLHACERLNCDKLTFLADKTWVRTTVIEGVREINVGKYEMVDWITVSMCESLPCANGIHYKATPSKNRLVLFRDESESFPCQSVEIFSRKPLDSWY